MAAVRQTWTRCTSTDVCLPRIGAQPNRHNAIQSGLVLSDCAQPTTSSTTMISNDEIQLSKLLSFRNPLLLQPDVLCKWSIPKFVNVQVFEMCNYEDIFQQGLQTCPGKSAFVSRPQVPMTELSVEYSVENRRPFSATHMCNAISRFFGWEELPEKL